MPPPAAPPAYSAAELKKLVAPIALHPDPLIAIILPASVYPLEIVQAARFIKDTNNVPKVDEQPWDENVKALATIHTQADILEFKNGGDGAGQRHVRSRKRKSDLKRKYSKMFSKVMPATKSARFFQLESQINMALNLRVTASLPLIK